MTESEGHFNDAISKFQFLHGILRHIVHSYQPLIGKQSYEISPFQSHICQVTEYDFATATRCCQLRAVNGPGEPQYAATLGLVETI